MKRHVVKKTNKAKGIIVAGVGGQGALTLAQLILGAAWKSKYHVLQSEVHGMSQRGGAVNAHILFDIVPVTSPVVMEGDAEFLISMEPLEALRYLPFMSKTGIMIVSAHPFKNMDNYPDVELILNELKSIDGVTLIDTEKYSKELDYKNAGNMILLGSLSNHLPFEDSIWEKIISERFNDKGTKVIEQNIRAFNFGKKL
jgi:indolepyruvate ferredoxin oxidoreductase beta subunit